MKSNLFKYSVLTVGVAAAMSATTIANAATPTGGTSGTFNVENQATASYTVAGNTTQQNAQSNKVTVNVSETGSFSLIATVADNVPNDNFNHDTINPQASSTVDFTHKLTNNGNVDDSYTVNLANATDDDFDYSLSSTTITYQKKDAGGTNVGGPVSIANNGKIDLAPGQSADITITAFATTERINNKTGSLTVTATSAYLQGKNTGAPAAYSASNIDHATTATPLYAITKSALTNLNNKTFDTNNAGAYVDYTITVKNEGTANGTAVNIIDSLPAGLVAIQSGETNYKAPTVVATSGSAAKAAVISTNGKEVSVTAQDIKIDETITVTFRAKKDTTTPATGTSITNYAVVRDSTKDNGTFDLVDSSGDAAGGVTEKTYEDTTATDYKGKDNNSNATITTSNQTRAIAISTGINKEVALISTNNPYIYTITNNGTDVTEAATANAVNFTVKPTAATVNTPDDPNITIGRVFADVNDNGTYDTGDIILTADTNGNYDLNKAAASGLAPKQSVKIGVEVSTNGSGSNVAGGTNNLGNSETMTIAVLPQGAVSGTPKPADVSTTSKTTMQGINLLKYQAVAECTTAVASIAESSWSQTSASATPSQCIFYRLEATNTFSTDSGINITNVALSDTLASKVTYRNDFVATPTATNQTVAPLVKGTFATLTPQSKATIKFSAKISQTGTN